MKFSEIKDKTKDELSELLISLKKEALNLRFQKANGELENTSRINKVRKDIARVNTVLAELISKQKQGEVNNA